MCSICFGLSVYLYLSWQKSSNICDLIIKNIKKWSRGVPQNVIDKVNHIFCQLYAAVV